MVLAQHANEYLVSHGTTYLCTIARSSTIPLYWDTNGPILFLQGPEPHIVWPTSTSLYYFLQFLEQGKISYSRRGEDHYPFNLAGFLMAPSSATTNGASVDETSFDKITITSFYSKDIRFPVGRSMSAG